MFSEKQEDKIQYSDGNQIPKLLMRTMPRDELIAKYLQGVEFLDDG